MKVCFSATQNTILRRHAAVAHRSTGGREADTVRGYERAGHGSIELRGWLRRDVAKFLQDSCIGVCFVPAADDWLLFLPFSLAFIELVMTLEHFLGTCMSGHSKAENSNSPRPLLHSRPSILRLCLVT